MKTSIFISLSLFLSVCIYGQTVTTITQGSPNDAISIDGGGNIYAAYYHATEGKVFKYDASWNVSTFFESPNSCLGLATNAMEQVYNCDGNGNTIRMFQPDGTLFATFPAVGFPADIVNVPGSEDMIFSTYSGNTINRLEPDGTITTISNDPLLDGPVGIAQDEVGGLYVGNYNNRKIYKVNNDGTLEYIATVGSMGNLGYIAYAQGMLWGTVLQEHKIYMIDPNNTDDVTLFAGSSNGTMDGDISVATFSGPNGITFNETGDTMYITEYNTQNIRIISNIQLGTETFKKSNVTIITPLNTNEIVIQARFPEKGSVTIAIYNVFGQTVYEKDLTTDQQNFVEKINTSTWAHGVYVAKLKLGSSSVTKKILIKNK
ncbi:MAG: T9SS type A sorting domain-containing protein [Aequorivita sp.]|nr:T9SS type A sorting domain-containing protein [Aequorivita sp.]